MITLRQKVKVYERLLHELHTACQITMNKERIEALLHAISAWSYAHRQGNGELTDRQQNKIINDAFKRIANLVHVDLQPINKIKG